MFEVELIDSESNGPTMFISHRELARFIFAVDKEPEFVDQNAGFIQRSSESFCADIKAKVLRLAEDRELQDRCEIIRSSFNAMLDLRAFHFLDEPHGWSTEVAGTMEYYLGEHGLEQVQMMPGVTTLKFDKRGKLVTRPAAESIDSMVAAGKLAFAQ